VSLHDSVLYTAKFGLTVFEEIIECPQCILSENVCATHAKDVKLILMQDVKNEIKKLMKKQYMSN